jgi:hypothetical protein
MCSRPDYPAIYDVVDGRLGGPKWLAAARRSLRDRGPRPIRDFVLELEQEQ